MDVGAWYGNAPNNGEDWMIWIILLSTAVSLIILSKRVTEEVHTLAVQATSLISFVWGFAWAPPSAQLVIASLIGSVAFLGKRA